MKKTLLFAFAMLFATAMMAQNRAVLLQESFDGTSMPAGWSVAGLGLGNWSVSPTNNAGGAANEMDRIRSEKGKVELRIVEIDLMEKADVSK